MSELNFDQRAKMILDLYETLTRYLGEGDVDEVEVEAVRIQLIQEKDRFLNDFRFIIHPSVAKVRSLVI